MTSLQWLCMPAIVGFVFFSGCAPSVNITPAGQDRQYEVSVSSDEFTISNTNDLINIWHEKAREACQGGNYTVMTRDIIQNAEPINETVMTGIIECE